MFEEHEKAIAQDKAFHNLLTTCKVVVRSLDDIEEMSRRITKDIGVANLTREAADWLRAAISAAEVRQ